jgi:aryl-alcohol dehydrogenase-like predicted oxidoreductase
MTFGEDWGWGATPEDSSKIIGTFLERGGNFVDTANFYTKGHSEKIIGDFIAQDRARRERMVLATKFFGNLYPGDPNGGGADRKAIVAQCEQSLRRLQTDYIDLYWLHMNDRFTPVEEPFVPSMTLLLRARCATTASPIPRPGGPRKLRRLLIFVAGLP